MRRAVWLLAAAAATALAVVTVASATMGRPAWTALDTWETNHPRQVNWGTNLVPTQDELADTSIIEKYRALAKQLTALT